MEQLPSEITPHAVELSKDRNNRDESNSTLSCATRDEDLKMHKKLFKSADYILMAPGYTMLGTYKLGSESDN